MDNAFLQSRIDATKGLIVAYEAALLALASGSTQSYTIDTGQTRQTVTSVNLKEIQDHLDVLYDRCSTLGARLAGSGVLIARPAW